MSWYMEVLKKYAVFNGRARRKEYWSFAVVNLIIYILLYVTSEKLSGIYALAVMVPTIAVQIRRLHDIDKSGWYVLLKYVPVVNIWLIVLMCDDGTYGSNSYGDSPK